MPCGQVIKKLVAMTLEQHQRSDLNFQCAYRVCVDTAIEKKSSGKPAAAALLKSTVQSIQHALSGKAFLWSSWAASLELLLYFSESAYVEWIVRQGDCQENNTSERNLKGKSRFAHTHTCTERQRYISQLYATSMSLGSGEMVL